MEGESYSGTAGCTTIFVQEAAIARIASAGSNRFAMGRWRCLLLRGSEWKGVMIVLWDRESSFRAGYDADRV
jgi:hypothetical protein